MTALRRFSGEWGTVTTTFPYPRIRRPTSLKPNSAESVFHAVLFSPSGFPSGNPEGENPSDAGVLQRSRNTLQLFLQGAPVKIVCVLSEGEPWGASPPTRCGKMNACQHLFCRSASSSRPSWSSTEGTLFPLSSSCSIA